MMDEFIHWPKPYLLLSATCDEILSSMIEIWMRKHLVSDSNCNTINLEFPKNLQGRTKNVGLTFSVGELYGSLQLVMSKTTRIGNTKYHIQCSEMGEIMFQSTSIPRVILIIMRLGCASHICFPTVLDVD